MPKRGDGVEIGGAPRRQIPGQTGHQRQCQYGGHGTDHIDEITQSVKQRFQRAARREGQRQDQ